MGIGNGRREGGSLADRGVQMSGTVGERRICGRGVWTRHCAQDLQSLCLQPVDIDRHVSPTEHHPDHRHPTRHR